jgi:hypothetical protein
LADYLPTDGAERRSLLIELMRVDMEFRRKAGLPAHIEQYLEPFLELATEATVVAPALGDDELPAAGAATKGRPAPPSSIGGYRILKRLGGGGMGEVYEAEEAASGQRAALKVIGPECATSAVPAETIRVRAAVGRSSR